MKVLLINPQYPFEENPTPPFGLMSLAAYLLEKGIEVRIEDYIITNFSKERVEKIITGYNPDVIGATGVTMNIKKAIKILKEYKKSKPEAITVLGGPHATFDAEDILAEHDYVDYIVRGEGELTFHEMLELIGSNASLEEVQGISFRKNNGIVHNPDRPLIEDINILPFPARHLVQLSKYRAFRLPINMITSRGCPYKCIFCVGSRMVGRKVRSFDVERVVDEFEMLSKMGFRQINIVDDLFTSNKNRCIAICQEILRRGIKHTWNAFARVDTISRELLEHLKEAGCTTLCFGIESGNQEILDRAKKKITIEKCERAIKLCNEVGVEPMTSYILGLPGESVETAKKTVTFAKELTKDFYGFHILSPFPGTEVRDKCDEYGIRILTSDWDCYDANQAVSETDSISHDEIEQIANEENASFDEYFMKVCKRIENGEPLMRHDLDTYNGIIEFGFFQDLIMKEYLEGFQGKPGSSYDELFEDFSAYLGECTEYSAEEIQKHITALLERDCIVIDVDSAAVKWVELVSFSSRTANQVAESV